MKITISFFLFSTLAFAQQPKSAFQKTIDSINTILYQTRKVRYINQEYNVYDLRKINAHKTGNVFLIETPTGDYTKGNYKMFHLLDVKEFVWKGKEIQMMDKKGQKIGAITNVNVQEIREFIKQLDVLRFICILYEKEDPKFKCD